MIYTGAVIGGVVSNKIAKPLTTDVKTSEDVTDYLSVVDSCMTAELLPVRACLPLRVVQPSNEK